jgi:hypothetical protein
MATESTINELGWGYIDDAYDYFVLHREDRILNKLIRAYEAKIRKDPAWMMTMKAKAETQKIPLDSMIHLDAMYLGELEMQK